MLVPCELNFFFLTLYLLYFLHRSSNFYLLPFLVAVLSLHVLRVCSGFLSNITNPLQVDSHSNSKMELAPTSQIPSPRVEKDNNRRERKMEAKGEDSSPTLVPPSSSSSCSAEEVGVEDDEKEERKKDPSGNSVEVEVEEEKETDQGKDVRDDDDDDDGYHTPTSPRHRIPEARVCPPAPKKPVHLLYMKRKARAGQAPRRLDEIEGEIGSFLGAELDDAGPRTKKARGEAANA